MGVYLKMHSDLYFEFIHILIYFYLISSHEL